MYQAKATDVRDVRYHSLRSLGLRRKLGMRRVAAARGLSEGSDVHSIRSRIAFLTVCSIMVTVLVISFISVIAVKSLGDNSSDETLALLCETGQKSLDSYLESVEQSVEAVSDYASADLATRPSGELDDHFAHVREVFDKTANKTRGVLTYYYRTDPTVEPYHEGFWYVDNGNGFEEHEVTDITKYDLDDTSRLVWFTIPRVLGEPVWQSPYITENLGTLVVSYDVPIYSHGVFFGVVGMEIDCSTLVDQVDDIVVHESGYAFVADGDRIVYHPSYGVMRGASRGLVPLPEALAADDTFIDYTFEGVEQRATWAALSNGMRLYVTVPLREIEAGWVRMAQVIVVAAVALLVIFAFVALRLADRITKPLGELTEWALKVDSGDYDVRPTYDGDDEVGILTRTFCQLMEHIKEHITNLNDLAYADALTLVRNKGAFDIFMANMQKRIDDGGKVDFGICVFDCNNLKIVNDQYGHDKGNVYLKRVCRLICEVFDHSPVFRTGGDEFVAILENVDYRDRDVLLERFDRMGNKMSAEAKEPWEKVSVARGVAVFEPDSDTYADDVVRRADKAMYEDKRRRKGNLA